MKKLLRGLSLSIILYCLTVVMTLMVVNIFGDGISDITLEEYLAMGLCSGIGATLINNEIE